MAELTVRATRAVVLVRLVSVVIQPVAMPNGGRVAYLTTLDQLHLEFAAIELNDKAVTSRLGDSHCVGFTVNC